MNRKEKVDFKLLNKILRMGQNDLANFLYEELVRDRKGIIVPNGGIMIQGDSPITLVAHMDTVFNENRDIDIKISKPDGRWLTATNGLGADDRAGIYAIYKIIEERKSSGKKLPSVLFTFDEEMGCVGVQNILARYEEPPMPITFFIELDRRGSRDAVFYACKNRKFKRDILDFGFNEANGSFSDILLLGTEWRKCGVNLSVGYNYEHSYAEILNLDDLNNTIKKVHKMIDKLDGKTYSWRTSFRPRFLEEQWG